MIDVDFTLGIQAVNFFIMLWFLNRFIFKPILNVADERERKMKELETEATTAADNLESAVASYDEGLAAIRRESKETVTLARKEAAELSSEIGESAREDYKKRITKATGEIEAQVDSASAVLKKEIGEFANTLAGKILGRKVS